MKYWRGYLTAAILAAITWALTQMAKQFDDLVDMIYPYVTRMVQNMLVDWSGGVDYLVWQVLAIAIVAVLLATIVLMVIFKWNPFQWFGWVLAAASFLFLLHTGLYGLNNYASPLAEDLRLKSGSYTASELADATRYYRDKANALAETMDRDENGDLVYSSFEELAEQAGDGFRYLVYERSFPVFAGSTAPVKKLGWSNFFTSAGITGVTMGITGEAAVNPNIPVVEIPFTMCHEMAHRMSIVNERDANFTGFLASRFNSSPEFQYSGYFMAYRHCLRALRSIGTSSANQAAAGISEGMNEYLRHDMEGYNELYLETRNDTADAVVTSVNDSMIKATGNEAGVESYDEVAELLVSWYIQEIILPTQVVEEVVFDPMDESQVDLSGNVNARVPETTEEP